MSGSLDFKLSGFHSISFPSEWGPETYQRYVTYAGEFPFN